MNVESNIINIKNRVKEVRKAKKISQQELADKVGTSRQTISHLENREYNPALKLAFRIATVLETPINELFELEDGDLDPEND